MDTTTTPRDGLITLRYSRQEDRHDKEDLVDAKFHPAMNAIKAGDVGRLRAIVQADPALATSRSTCSHPTLLQCLVLDAKDSPSQIEMARILIDAGADVNEPLVAA